MLEELVSDAREAYATNLLRPTSASFISKAEDCLRGCLMTAAYIKRFPGTKCDVTPNSIMHWVKEWYSLESIHITGLIDGFDENEPLRQGNDVIEACYTKAYAVASQFREEIFGETEREEALRA